MSTPAPSTAPDWQLIPFDVGCARCGQDLRGLVEPKCPACALEFDWSVAVPVEELTCSTCGYHLFGLTQTRCPECGTGFIWEEALAEHHRRRLPLFEYHWRKRPIRSLIATWRLSLGPKRLWRTIDIHDPPRIGALVVITVFFILVFSVGTVVLNDVCDWAGELLGDLIGQRLRYFRGWGGPLYWDLASPLVFSIGWLGGVLAVLGTLRWSMAACRIKPAHVLRVTAYSFISAAAIPAVMLITVFAYDLFMAMATGFIPPALDNLLGVLVRVVIRWLPILAVLSAIPSLARAYRWYIRMPHALGVAIAAGIAGAFSGLNATFVLALIRG